MNVCQKLVGLDFLTPIHAHQWSLW